ncbi:acyl-CoA dehydrogenase [Kitasatospora sp. MMS16-BH015]|uniref:acyl-CoA dehydrogenase family protein n=1 Tax=Kitasatospora sp. MMS16-BH015 TaxID=2018025 RepID=UPI000CA1A218|nr:acyl-CoA dehydrogenase [Kitasatospora sp. MMS16-BH015]AUG78206.1 acyl-CoA dehydrogenase [Kitasatospora sp. MMS16-BH015]
MSTTRLRPSQALDRWLDEAEAGPGLGTAALDRAEEFPARIVERLDAFELPAYYVPAQWGGELDDHEELFRLWRAAARRDVSAVVAHGKTYLGAVSVWLTGSPEQCEQTAAAILDGERISWALSEPEHGADLLAGSVTARRTAAGYTLDGTKWPINNATRGSRLTVLARTGEQGGSRGQSLFLVDKSELGEGSYQLLPKARTHGVRGVDISGIAFEGAELPERALLGAEGGGAETVLRALQLTRTMCSALSAGAGEHALRIVVGFAAERIIQEQPLITRPNVRAVLARSAALLAAVEAAAVHGSRSIHALTGEMSVVSAVVKALAPSLVDGVITDLAEVLGSRAFLAEEYAEGAFQKIQRDHQVVAIFDGSTVVNRNSLINQFPRLVRGFAAGTADAEGLARAAALDAAPGPLDFDRLTLLSRTGCSTVQALPATVEALAGLGASDELQRQAKALVATGDELHRRMADVRPSPRPSMASFELAAAYETLYAAAACLQLWTANAATAAGPLWEDALWLRVTLRELHLRLLKQLGEARPPVTEEDTRLTDQLVDRIAQAVADGTPLTPLGQPTGQPTETPDAA